MEEYREELCLCELYLSGLVMCSVVRTTNKDAVDWQAKEVANRRQFKIFAASLIPVSFLAAKSDKVLLEKHERSNAKASKINQAM